MHRLAGLIVALVLLAGAGAAAYTFMQRGEAQGDCAATLSPGADITRAVDEAEAGATLCLAAGVHRAVKVNRARPGLTLRGGGAETVILADPRDGIDITQTDRFTLADLTVRGGDPAGVYASRATSLTLRKVRVESAAIGIHLEGGSSATLTEVTISRSTDFGLLARRGASANAAGLRVLERTGIGVGAVDVPGSMTLTDVEIGRAAGNARGEGMVLNGFERFALSNVMIAGGNPAGMYVAKARELSLRGVRVDGATFGLHVDDNAVGTLDDVTLAGSTGVGLLLQRGGAVSGQNVRVLDTVGTGVSAINGAGLLTLRDSEISRVAAAGLFAGVAGCADLPPASLDVPECFYKDLRAQISTIRVQLERVTMADTQGPCLVFFPGVRAEIRGSSFTRCELTGLFAWGAQADVSGSTFDDTAEHALEYRAYPKPVGEIIAPASGTISDSVVRATRPLEGAILGAAGPGPVLGGGLLAQGARLVVERVEVTGNRDIGVSYVNGSTGAVTNSRITANGGYGLCLLPNAAVEVRDTTITGNRSDSPTICGGRPR